MSLFIVGSCSRITSNIIQTLARNKQYESITIGDLIPTYSFHNRYYRLRKDLDQQNLSIKVNIEKLHETQQISDLSKCHDDVLYVSHDYFQTVTSKLRLMELTALANKTRNNLYFATPVEYDQFAYSNPEERYLAVQSKVMEINPNSTIIRSDVQDFAESIAYSNIEKNVLDDQLFKLSFNQKFKPKIVSTKFYANFVAQTMKDKVQGKLFCLTGKEEENPREVDFDRNIERWEIDHMKANIRNMVSKYSGVLGQGSEEILSSNA